MIFSIFNRTILYINWLFYDAFININDFSHIPLPSHYSLLILLVFLSNTPTSIDLHLFLFIFVEFVEFCGLDVFFSGPVNLLLFTEALFTVATLTVSTTLKKYLLLPC